jgi:hypothetical protein
MGRPGILMRPGRGRIDSRNVPPIASSVVSITAPIAPSVLSSISGVAGDVVAVVLGLLIFAVLFVLLEGIDRI